MGLSWGDIDFGHRTALISKSWDYKLRRLGPTKTREAREIDLTPKTVEVLARLREKTQGLDSEPVFCTKSNLIDPRSVELASMFGFDCICLCTEHVPNTLHDVENMIRTAKIYGVDSLVRVPRGSYSDLIHPLEMDAAGIMVPHCMSAEDAR